MKILWLHSHLLNQDSGGSRYITDYILYLSSQGHNITLWCDQIDILLQKKLAENGVITREIDNLSTYSPMYWLTLIPRLKLKKRKFNKSYKKFDLVVTSLFPMNVVVSEATLPILQICFEPFAFFYDKRFISNLTYFQRLFFFIMKLLYSKMDITATKKASKIITISKESQKNIQSIYNEKSEIVLAGVNKSKYQFVNDKKIADFRKSYSGNPLLFHSTDWSGSKGTKELISIIENIKNSYFQNITLIISYYIDNPKIFSSIVSYCKGYPFVQVVKKFPLEEMPLMYLAVDAVVQPNIQRTVSWPLRESLIAGTPFIGGSMSEEVSLARNAIAIDPLRKEESVKKMLKFFKSAIRYPIGKQGDVYSFEKNAKKLESILKSL